MSTENIRQFKHILTSNGHRVTSTRIATFRLLQDHGPQSVSQLLQRANGAIDRVSIYRNIELFEKLGIVRRIHIGWKYKIELSDTFIAHHHHLHCLRCGKLIDIEDEAHLDEFIRTVASKVNFSPRLHHFEVDGYCSDCATK